MSELPDESVHLCVTSPPYWGLRKYAGVPDLVFDGKANCQHEWGEVITERVDKTGFERNRRGLNRAAEISDGNPRTAITNNPAVEKRSQFCLKCDAWRGQLGQEPTPELYIKHIVDIFREVKRVLRSDGVCFVNIGDTYSATRWSDAKGTGSWASQRIQDANPVLQKETTLPIGNKCLIPFRLALALQEDGWWVRQDIIWAKNNPMPESVSSPRWVRHRIKIKSGRYDSNQKQSVTQLGAGFNERCDGKEGWAAQWQDCPGCEKCLPNDGLVLRHGSWRPTESHEYILMLTKSNDYYCDGEAVRLPLAEATIKRAQSPFYPERGEDFRTSQGIKRDAQTFNQEVYAKIANGEKTGRNLRSVWTFSTQSYGDQLCLGCGIGYTTRQYRRFMLTADKKRICPNCGGTKWVSHYATFPEKLPELCIKAGTSEYGVCAECGKPWARILKQNITNTRPGLNTLTAKSGNDGDPNQALHQSELSQYRQEISYQTLGWRATCNCQTDKPLVPAIVLDPFVGTGTTLAVARQLGRKAIGYELSEDYCKLTVKRIEKETAPMRLE